MPTPVFCCGFDSKTIIMRKIIIALFICLPLFSFNKVAPTIEASCVICTINTVDFTGSGYKPNREMMVHIFKEGVYVGGRLGYTSSDSNGDIQFTYFFEWGVGNYRVEVWQRTVKSRIEFMTSINITIQ